MARSLFTVNLASIIGSDSAISVAAKLYFLESDQVTPATSYTTAGGSTANANPMPTQADGRFAEQAWLEPGTYYYALVAPGGTLASPLVTGTFIANPGPDEIDPDLDAFLAGDTPLPIANGGTFSTNAADALIALGAFSQSGGTVTGDIDRQGYGTYHFWNTAAMNNGGWFITVDSDPDPTTSPGQVWLRYA